MSIPNIKSLDLGTHEALHGSLLYHCLYTACYTTQALQDVFHQREIVTLITSPGLPSSPSCRQLGNIRGFPVSPLKNWFLLPLWKRRNIQKHLYRKHHFYGCLCELLREVVDIWLNDLLVLPWLYLQLTSTMYRNQKSPLEKKYMFQSRELF